MRDLHPVAGAAAVAGVRDRSGSRRVDLGSAVCTNIDSVVALAGIGRRGGDVPRAEVLSDRVILMEGPVQLQRQRANGKFKLPDLPCGVWIVRGVGLGAEDRDRVRPVGRIRRHAQTDGGEPVPHPCIEYIAVAHVGAVDFDGKRSDAIRLELHTDHAARLDARGGQPAAPVHAGLGVLQPQGKLNAVPVAIRGMVCILRGDPDLHVLPRRASGKVEGQGLHRALCERVGAVLAAIIEAGSAASHARCQMLQIRPVEGRLGCGGVGPDEVAAVSV